MPVESELASNSRTEVIIGRSKDSVSYELSHSQSGNAGVQRIGEEIVLRARGRRVVIASFGPKGL